MIERHQIDPLAERLEQLLAQKFGLSSGPLSRRLARLGRRLPAAVRDDMARIVAAQAASGHPKLALQHDLTDLRGACQRAEAHLQTIDVKDRRRGALLSLLADVMLKVLIVATLVVVVLVWRGLV